MNHLTSEVRAALEELRHREDPDRVGLVLTGSAARGMATNHSDQAHATAVLGHLLR